jgi:hypothetical protein
LIHIFRILSPPRMPFRHPGQVANKAAQKPTKD